MSAPLTPLSAAGLNAKSPSKSIQKGDCSRSRAFDEPFASKLSINTLSAENIPSGGAEQLSNSPIDVDVRQRELFDVGNVVLTPTKAPSPSDDSPVKNNIPLRSRETTPLRYNEGLTRVMQTMKDDVTLDYQDEGDTMTTIGAESVNGDIDDTAFSTFSAVPNADMTLFARFGQDTGGGSGSLVKGLGIDKHRGVLVSDTVSHDNIAHRSHSI